MGKRTKNADLEKLTELAMFLKEEGIDSAISPMEFLEYERQGIIVDLVTGKIVGKDSDRFMHTPLAWALMELEPKPKKRKATSETKKPETRIAFRIGVK